MAVTNVPRELNLTPLQETEKKKTDYAEVYKKEISQFLTS
jgi:hypothetical protein